MVFLEEVFLVMCAFSKKKVHSLSVAPEPLAIWNKELESLDSESFKELKTFPVVAPERIPGFFQKELGYRILACSLVVCCCQM